MDGRCGGACGRGGWLPIATGGVRSIYGGADDDPSTEHRGSARGRGALLSGRAGCRRASNDIHAAGIHTRGCSGNAKLPAARRNVVSAEPDESGGWQYNLASNATAPGATNEAAVAAGGQPTPNVDRAVKPASFTATGYGTGYDVARNTDDTSAGVDSNGADSIDGAQSTAAERRGTTAGHSASQRRGASGRRWTTGAGRFSATVGRDQRGFSRQ